MFNADSKFLRCTLAVVASFAAAGCGGTVIDEDYDVDQQGLLVRRDCVEFKTQDVCLAHQKRCDWLPNPIPLGAPGSTQGGLGIYTPPTYPGGGQCVAKQPSGGKDAGGVVTSDGGVICAIAPNGGSGSGCASTDAGTVVTSDGGSIGGKADAGTAQCSKGSVLVFQIGGPALQYPPPGPHCSAVTPACTAISSCSCLSASEGRCSPSTSVAGACTCDNGIR